MPPSFLSVFTSNLAPLFHCAALLRGAEQAAACVEKVARDSLHHHEIPKKAAAQKCWCFHHLIDICRQGSAADPPPHSPLASLPSGEREAFALYSTDALDPEELAIILGIELQELAVRLDAARQLLGNTGNPQARQ